MLPTAGRCPGGEPPRSRRTSRRRRGIPRACRRFRRPCRPPRGPGRGEPRKQCEYVVYAMKHGSHCVHDRCLPGVYRHPVNTSRKRHRTEKPVPLLIDLLEITSADATVPAPFMGHRHDRRGLHGHRPQAPRHPADRELLHGLVQNTPRNDQRNRPRSRPRVARGVPTDEKGHTSFLNLCGPISQVMCRLTLCDGLQRRLTTGAGGGAVGSGGHIADTLIGTGKGLR